VCVRVPRPSVRPHLHHFLANVARLAHDACEEEAGKGNTTKRGDGCDAAIAITTLPTCVCASPCAGFRDFQSRSKKRKRRGRGDVVPRTMLRNLLSPEKPVPEPTRRLQSDPETVRTPTGHAGVVG
jgi:hypothetical protein